MRKFIKQNDTKPYVRVTLYDVSGDPPARSTVDLSGDTVKFIMRLRGSDTAKVDSAATDVDFANGQVEYRWVTGNTDEAGEYQTEWQVTEAGGAIKTYWDLRTADDIDNERLPDPLIIVIVDDFA